MIMYEEVERRYKIWSQVEMNLLLCLWVRINFGWFELLKMLDLRYPNWAVIESGHVHRATTP